MQFNQKNPHWIISKLAGDKNVKPRSGVLKWKLSGNTTENPFMESKITEFGLILLHIYNKEQTELIFIILFFIHKLQEFLVR